MAGDVYAKFPSKAMVYLYLSSVGKLWDELSIAPFLHSLQAMLCLPPLLNAPVITLLTAPMLTRRRVWIVFLILGPRQN